MPAGYPSGTNTYVPNHAASQSLVVGFSRNPKTFPLPQYVQYVRAGNNVGLYLVWTSQQAARILTADDAEHVWADGDAAPQGANNLESMQWQGFRTVRRAYPFILGRMAVEQASFPLIAAEASVGAQQCMTARTMLVHTALTNATWGTNTAAVKNGILGASEGWDTGSDGIGSNQGANIKKSLNYGSIVVHQATLGVVQPWMLTLVINPNTARRMAESTEIQDYIKQSPFALAQLRGDVPSQNGKWGLPDVLYGHPVSVEDTVRISSNPQATTTSMGYVMPNDTGYLLARQGELEGLWGSRSYSTVQVFFFHDEMTVYTKYDVDNERYQGRVIQDLDAKVVSVQSGFRFTTVFNTATP